MTAFANKSLVTGFRSSRGISIIAALLVDFGLAFLFLFGRTYEISGETFWVVVLVTFAAYAVLQIWTLSTMTGRGDDFTAAADKFIALSPLVIVAILEAYLLGARGIGTISWRLHLIAAIYAIFALTDFFSTDITNQRLRTRQIDVGSQMMM